MDESNLDDVEEDKDTNETTKHKQSRKKQIRTNIWQEITYFDEIISWKIAHGIKLACLLRKPLWVVKWFLE